MTSDSSEVTGSTSAEGALFIVQRSIWTIAWIAVLASALQYWGSWSAGLWAAVLAPVLVLVALVGIVLVWTVPRPLSRVMQWTGLVAALVMVAVEHGTDIHLRHFYSTDSGAFNQVATRLLLNGKNPYDSSMAAAARLLHPASAFWTYQFDGVHTEAISYPAGSFLLQAPFMALGMHHMVTDWVDLGAWLVTAVLVFCMVPSYLRWLAPILVMTGALVGPFANGGTDALFLPFLVIAVWHWDRFPGRAAAWLPSWVGPAALGVACSIKQTPWFCIPFLLVGVACEVRRAGGRPLSAVVRYGLFVAGSFVAVNLAFIIWSPTAWLKGTLLPMVDPLVADGQGVVTLALHGLTGGVVMAWLTVAAVLALIAMLAAYALWEARFRRAWLFLVPLVLFLPDRSLTNYLLDLAPAALVAALSIAAVVVPAGAVERHSARRPNWLAPVGVAIPVVASLVALGVAFTSAPLEIAVGRVVTTGVATVDGGLTMASVDVTVHNRSGHALLPRFMVSFGGGHPSGFWRAQPVGGTASVGAGATSRFTLRPAHPYWAPTHGQRWLVDAYTTSPNALSTSPMQWARWGIVGH